MNSKGIVIAVKGRHAIILTPDGLFIKQKMNYCPLVGEEIEFSSRVPYSDSGLRKFIVAAAIVVCMISAFIWQSFVPGPSHAIAYVTVDINPSFDLGVDRRLHVVEVQHFNEEGKLLLSQVPIKGKQLGTAIELLAKAAEKQGYFQNDEPTQVLISWTRLEGKAKEADALEKTLYLSAIALMTEEKDNLMVEILPVSFEARNNAMELGLSPGKYAVLREAQNSGLIISTDDLKHSNLTKAIKKAGGNPGLIISQTVKNRKSESAQEIVGLAAKVEEINAVKKSKVSSVGASNTQSDKTDKPQEPQKNTDLAVPLRKLPPDTGSKSVNKPPSSRTDGRIEVQLGNGGAVSTTEEENKLEKLEKLPFGRPFQKELPKPKQQQPSKNPKELIPAKKNPKE